MQFKPGANSKRVYAILTYSITKIRMKNESRHIVIKKRPKLGGEESNV